MAIRWIDNRFYPLFVLYVLALGIALWLIPKPDLHLLLCDRHNEWRDLLYSAYTHIGAAGPYVVAAILLLWGKKYLWDAGLLLVGEWTAGIVVQIIKTAVNADRPVEWFMKHMPEVSLPMVEGQRIAYYFSFPSGHTCTCFVLFLFLSMMAGRIERPIVRHLLQTACLLAAILGAYSRVYLSMHFALDTWAGAIIGVVVMTTWACFWPKLISRVSKKGKK